MGGQNKNSEVILLLENSRFTLNKKLLIKRSKYFDALLSKKYIDHLKKEHVINYNISIPTLQNYISWINGKSYYHFDYKLKEYFQDKNGIVWNSFSKKLIDLLYVSVLFATDQLTEEIILILEKSVKQMGPENIIDTWLTATDLGIRTLRDIYFAECLDSFCRLPINKLIHLESHNLQNLLNNKNILSTKEHMAYVLFKWKTTNRLRKLQVNMKNKEPRILHCIVDYDNYLKDFNNKIVLYCWDGTKFFKYSTLTYPKFITRRIRMLKANSVKFGKKRWEINLYNQVSIGQRFDLYFGGGKYVRIIKKNKNEHMVRTVAINTSIWRYSFISKQWYFETDLPERYLGTRMLTVCANQKLYFIWARHGFRESEVHIYNTHTKIWTKGSSFPEDTPICFLPYYIGNNKIILFNDRDVTEHIWLYYTEENVWKRYKFSSEERELFDEFSEDESYFRAILMQSNTTIPSFARIDKHGKTNCINCMCQSVTSNITKLVVQHAIYGLSNTKCQEKNKNYKCKVVSPLRGNGQHVCTDGPTTDLMQTYIIRKKKKCGLIDCDNHYACILFNDKVRFSDQIYPNFHVHTFKILDSTQWKEFRLVNFHRHFPLLDAADLYSE